MNEVFPWHEPLNRATHRLRRYSSVVMWLMRDGVLRFRRRVAVILAASAAGMGLQLAAFGLIFALAHSLERDTALHVVGLTLAPRASPGVLVGLAVLVALLLAVAALLIFVARTRGVDLRRRYEVFCSKRALLLASRLPLPGADRANRILAENGLATITNRQARISGRVLWVLVNGTIPAARALVALTVMFVISWSWTVWVIALAPIAGYVLYGVNVSAARATWRRDRLAAPASRVKRRVMKRLQLIANPLQEADAVVDELYHQGHSLKAADSFYERFLIRERAQLVTNLFTAVAILAVLLVGAMEGSRGGMSWTVFATFLVALRFFLTSAKGIVSIFVQISRFYPYLRNYFDFIEDARRAERTVRIEDASRCVKLDLPSLEGGHSGLTLNPGECVWLLSATRVDRALAARLQLHTVADEGVLPASYWFAAATEDLAHAHQQPHSAVLLDAGLLRACTESERHETLAAFHDRVLVVVEDSLSEVNGAESPIVILNEDTPDEQGWCTAGWLKEHRAVWDRALTRHARRRRAAADPDEEDEDEF